ncbi:undecaprenyl-phosphate galactose phosphotransferase WbaP [Veillonella sp. R32]|uniref:undecaprenyl-phosphate galactose phosphotransferase WbaP n=1 Tax=Veillonella sp. R32 TaxID=2021312 RepID=UPI00138A097C|nr:undecaprenyl-phosphate galactose phosphotransferase WbaP [Veillonella sp. R32]KAF1680118.1 UDP-phosphate galactose phosphotransferase [Veillonella sp. R32]
MKSSIPLLNRQSGYLLPVLVLIIDYFMVTLGIVGAYEVRKLWPFPVVASTFSIKSIYMYLIAPALFLFMLFLCNGYREAAPYWDRVRNIFKATTYSIVLTVFLMYAANVAGDVSRLFIAFSWIFTFTFLLIGRYLFERILIARGFLKIPVIIIGAGKTAELLLKSFERHPIMRYEIVGFIDDNPICKGLTTKYPLLGGFDEIEDIICHTKIQHVIICAPGLEASKLIALITKLEILVKNVSFVPELIGMPAANVSVQGLMEENMLLINVKNNLARPYYRVMKRLFDLILTLIGLVVFIPVGIIIAIMIYIQDPGPILFSHRRVGQDGKEFDCYKFRSMIVNAESVLEKYLNANPELRKEWECDFKLKDDPRITKIGHFLRKTSLDELPQLINVLKGEMSLVGPRPIVKAEINKYGEYIQDFYLVPPGITGVWQVSGRSDTTYDERVQMDAWYVHNWSVWIDIVYLIKTVKIVLQKKGAY